MLKWNDYYDLMNVYMVLMGIFVEKNMKREDKLSYVSWSINELKIIGKRVSYCKRLQNHLDGVSGQLSYALKKDNIPLIRAALHPLQLILENYEPRIVCA